MTATRLAVVPPSPRRKPLDTAAARVEHFREGLQRQELSPKTVEQYARIVAGAEYWCAEEGYTLRNVPAVVFGQYVEARPKTYASRLVLRAALTQYWTIFKRKDPPLWMVRVPKRPKMVCRALTDDEAVALAAKARERGDRQGLAVLFAMYQAFRREEIASVRWEDITDDGWLSVMGKGTQPARLPLHPVVGEALASFPRQHGVWVFPGRPGRSRDPHVSPNTIWQWVLEVAADSGLERVSTHRLRHTCLAVANDATGDLRAVQDFARHAKVDTTSGYTRSTAKRLVAVMNSVRYEQPPSDELHVSAERILAAVKELERFALGADEGRRRELAEVAEAVEGVILLSKAPVGGTSAVPIGRPEPAHGTNARYRRGCQCAACVTEGKGATAAWRAKRADRITAGER